MDRRTFLSGSFSLAALNPTARADDPPLLQLRGSIDANEGDLVPNSTDDQGGLMQRLLRQAAAKGEPLVLRPGQYLVSNIVLPTRARIIGVPGATRLVFAGDGHMLAAENCERIELTGLIIDGAGKVLADYVPGLVHIASAEAVLIENCKIVSSTRSGLALDRSGGAIRGCSIDGIAEAGIRAVEATGLSIRDNHIADCGETGILIQRWTEGEDGTRVIGNRVDRIGTKPGAARKAGDGISVFRAHGVAVADNRIKDCAGAAVRAAAARNLQVTGNNCLRSGKAGVFAEFGYDGVVVANNTIDGGASGVSLLSLDAEGRVAVVAGNIIRNLSLDASPPDEQPGAGIGIAVSGEAAISGNVIDGAPRYGILMGWGPHLRDVTATGNIVRRAPVGIGVSVVEGAGAAIVSDNIISGATGGAILALRWAEPASGDLTQTDSGAFPSLSVTRNRVS